MADKNMTVVEDDELREEIASEAGCYDPPYWDKYEVADHILSLLVPELEKARKWDEVKKILDTEWPANHKTEAIKALEGGRA